MARPRPDLAWLLAILLLGAALRGYQLGAQSLWFDEGIAVNAATRPSLAEVVLADPTNPPLYYLLLHLGTRLAGDELLALRGFSVLLGLLAIPLTYLLARSLFSPRAGRYAALLAAVSPPLWWASQEVRMYGLMAALALLAALGWHRLLDRPTWRAWALLWTAELLLLYTHSSAPVWALWLNVVTLLAWLAARSPARPDWKLWLAGQAGVVLLWSPWLLTRFLALPAANRTAPAPPSLEPALLAHVWQGFWTAPWAMVDQVPVLVWLAALLALLTLVLVPWRLPAARWLMVHALVLVTGLVAALLYVGIALHGRYLVPIAPLLLAALGAGLARLHGPVASRRSLLAPLALAPFLATSGLSVFWATQTPAFAHDDVAALVRYYSERLGPGDTVLAWGYTDDRYDLAYYWDRLGVRARRVVLPENGDPAAIAALLPTTGRVALNVWYAQVGDRGGLLDCLLGHGTDEPPEQVTVNGMSSRLYRSPATSRPALRPLSARFAVALLAAVGELREQAADRALCVPVLVTLLQPTTRDLSAALIVRNALGWEIARADRLLVGPGQKGSSQLGPGAALYAYPLLRLPYGAPAGDYSVVLRLYDDATLSGYDVLSDAGAPAGRDLLIGTWRVHDGAWAEAARPAGLPVLADLPVGDDLVLVAHDAERADPLDAGATLQLSFLWRGRGALPTLTLRAADGGWQVELPPSRPADHAAVTLDWRTAQLPPLAEDGRAVLALPDGRPLARYLVRAKPLLLTPPEFTTPVGVRLPGVGELVGYTLHAPALDRSRPFDLTLVWRADAATPGVSYTVFVQLLDADGRLIAQSDAPPARGERPTTGWRPGEYVVDPHRLQFHPNAKPGPARLIAGMYDAASGRRLLFEHGENAVTLAEDLAVR